MSSENGNRPQGPAEYLIGEERYPRVPFGSETDEPDGDGPCAECGALLGELHTPGCDAEECPFCQYPIQTCDCEVGL